MVKTCYGRYICAIGGNKEAARYSGVSVDKYQILTFVISWLQRTHPDRTSLLDVGYNSGIYHDLVRDKFGKLVDFLEIHGNFKTDRV